MTRDLLNSPYIRSSMRQRYEVWFAKLKLADGSGAWWFRYLLMNLAGADGGGCPGSTGVHPVQVWASWFPAGEKPEYFIQGFSRQSFSLSGRTTKLFHLEAGENRIGEDSCAGRLRAGGREINWDVHYHSSARFTMSDAGWIGFSRTTHSDATFEGEIALDDRRFQGAPLGYGVQGHNGGSRHRRRWTWAHAVFLRRSNSLTSFEALEYELPFGMKFRKAVLWHEERMVMFKRIEELDRDRKELRWKVKCEGSGCSLIAELDGSGISSLRLPYARTDCSGSFEVANNSLARAELLLTCGSQTEKLVANGGAVVEMAGD